MTSRFGFRPYRKRKPRKAGERIARAFEQFEKLEWCRVLGFNPRGRINLEKVQSTFRRLAKLQHPDVGGDSAKFRELVTARNNAVRWLNVKASRIKK